MRIRAGTFLKTKRLYVELGLYLCDFIEPRNSILFLGKSTCYTADYTVGNSQGVTRTFSFIRLYALCSEANLRLCFNKSDPNCLIF